MRTSMLFLLVSVSLLSWAPDAAAQPGQGGRGTVTGSRNGRVDVAYTGIFPGGRPVMAPDGSPRWADYPEVREVAPGSPADRVGIQPGDVLLLVNGKDARDPRTLIAEPGTVFTIRLRRGTTVHEFVLTSVRQPAND